MRKYFILCFVLFLGIAVTWAQDFKPVAQEVINARNASIPFKEAQEVFNIKQSNVNLPEIADMSKVIFFDYDRNYYQNELLPKENKALSLQVSLAPDVSVTMDVVEVSQTFYLYDVVTSSGQQLQSNANAKHYRGIVRGMPQESLVSLSFFEDQIMGSVTISGVGNFTIGKLKNGSDHIIYNTSNVKKAPNLSCETPEDSMGLPYSTDHLFNSDPNRSEVRCVKMYFETEYDIFQTLGSVVAVENYVVGLFNEVATLYANESISTEISEIKVWDTVDPYNGTDTATLLTEFQANTNGFNGDLGQLLTRRPMGGRAAGFAGLCNPDQDQSLSVSGSLEMSFPSVPTYSWSVMVVTHEFGHLFGSRHTHACVWNGNNTAIDSCSGFTEGGCPLPGSPAGGGTIMSYCHLDPVGIDFTQGFGPQPGNLIRNRVAAALCLTDCFMSECAFIEMVRLFDDSYQNSSGASSENYTDYTQAACIPIFETQFQQINIEASTTDVYLALFVDLNGDGDFCDPGEELYNAFDASGSTGVSFVGLINNGTVIGNETVRVVVSDSPISCDQIPECGEAEDYRLCPPCNETPGGCLDFNCRYNTTPVGNNCTATCDQNMLDGWGGFNIEGISYRNVDSQGGVNDYYLYLDDGSCGNGGTFAFNHDDFAGNWLDFGRCICFDLNAFSVQTGTINGSSSLRIGNGPDSCTSTIVATFVLDNPIDVSDGWVNICAPVGVSESGVLPGNDVGHWVINTGLAADWDALIQNVQSLLFYVDVASGDERWGLDNICFDECIDCDDFDSADFSVTQICSSEGVTISVDGFELYDNLGATHEWYIVSSPNQGAGPYTPVTSTTTTGPGPHVLATNLPDELYYTVYHKVITEDCGEICFAIEVWCFRGTSNVRMPAVDCCLIFEFWPDGPGDPTEFTAEFNHEITLANIINAVPVNDYSGNPSVVHEWYLYSREQLNSGLFTFITMQTGVNFSWGTAQNGVYYYLLHHVISDCGEVCYIRAIYKSKSSGGQNTREECDICGPIDCRFIDNPNGLCEITTPINLQVSGSTLTWDPVPGATSYIVESTPFWPNECSCTNPISILPIQTTQTTAQLPVGGGRCFVIQVRAICADGTSSGPSDWICVGGNGHGKNMETFIIPNPNDGSMKFQIRTESETKVEIKVYDFQGALIETFDMQTLSNEMTSLSWDGTHLRKGVYFVKFISENDQIIKKLVVQ
ncbi:MAG: zinc-dependent metalloprotease [Flavobacteriaceae bacterium]